MITRLLLIIMLAAALVACSPTTSTPGIPDLAVDRLLARDTLLDFLSALHNGSYADAALLYGGGYDVMRDHNPLLDPDDHAALLRNACTINGAACMKVLSIELVPTDYDRIFVFKVQFQQDDGSLFVLDPCINSGSGSPPVSSFLLGVSNEQGGMMLVKDMPPYLP